MPRPFMTPDEFKAIRHAKGWTQETIATFLGVKPRTIYNYETGFTRIPRVAQLALDRFAHLVAQPAANA